MATPTDPTTAEGIHAAQAGDRVRARQLLELSLQRDQDNVAAWWWLAETVDDESSRRQCLEKARTTASKSDQALATYRALLAETGAEVLAVYMLSGDSRSVGVTCPIDTVQLETGDLVTICPACALAHHSGCWEFNAYHCGNYACDGSGLIEAEGLAQVEPPPARDMAVVIGEEEVPDKTPWQSREEQEAGFVGRLQQQAAAMLFAGVARQAMMEEMAWQYRRQQEERNRRLVQERQARLFRRVLTARLIGLLPGIVLATGAFQHTHSWAIAIYVVYLTATGLAVAVGQASLSGGTVNVLYRLLPFLVAAAILFVTYRESQNGLLAVAVAWIAGLTLSRVSRVRVLYERRAFIIWSVLGLGSLFALWAILGFRS